MKTIKKEKLEYLAAENISAPHCFTTRHGGISVGTQASLNIAFGRGDSMENVEENIRILARELDFDENRLVLTRQTHSDIVRVVSAADHATLCHREYPECDGLVTNDPGTALMIFTADCTPILFHDPVIGTVGACHAGWRGTVQAIAAKTVEAMTANFGCDPKNIRAAIGPNIGPCHFETHADVPEALEAAFGSEIWNYTEKRGEKFFPDLKKINAMVLKRAGVENIDISDNCTYCEHDRFFSHRFTNGERGSQGAIIVCREVGK